ncbi:MlaD family protein [Hydrogenophaga sp. PAMC20947]|uniref:MlaD family protein n=1 Tax=Hydrogenophaga sp. PAMC20947 TaxID=2565558 RepID=UPI00109D96E3|nr:MlaD family protein [Hydrogenophaga sp. PAMC20947]QCB45285.1 MCE family protein [Hydrogenophaga sp. PAMC20947]
MENKAHALAAGTFVLVVAALLLGLATWLSRDKQVGDVYELSTSDAVTGLSEQAAVRFRGITVGKVTHIGFDPLNKGHVLLRINVDKGLPLTRSAYGTLGYQGVTGLAFVQLDNDGDSDVTLTTNEDEPTRIPLRPGLLSKFADQGSFILEQVQQVSERVSELLSPANQQAIIGSVKAIGDSATQLGAASERIQGILEAQLGPQRTDIPAFIGDARATMSTLQTTVAELNTTAKAATQTAQSLTQMAQGIAAPGGMLEHLSDTSKALADSARAINETVLPNAARAADSAARTADAATRAAQGLDRAVDTFNDNPQSLLFGPGNPSPGPGEPGFVAPQPAAKD